MHQKIKFTLTSGRELTPGRIQLFPADKVREIARLKAEAQEELSGVSAGLVPFGSAGWVMGGAFAIGLIESLITNSKAKKGIELVREAATKYELLKQTGVMFDVSAISGLEEPSPDQWTCTIKSEKVVEMDARTKFGKLELMERYNLSSLQIQGGQARFEVSDVFIHNGDAFVRIDIEGQLTAIRWESVENYCLL
jgi:hypothetical protein